MGNPERLDRYEPYQNLLRNANGINKISNVYTDAVKVGNWYEDRIRRKYQSDLLANIQPKTFDWNISGKVGSPEDLTCKKEFQETVLERLQERQQPPCAPNTDSCFKPKIGYCAGMPTKRHANIPYSETDETRWTNVFDKNDEDNSNGMKCGAYRKNHHIYEGFEPAYKAPLICQHKNDFFPVQINWGLCEKYRKRQAFLDLQRKTHFSTTYRVAYGPERHLNYRNFEYADPPVLEKQKPLVSYRRVDLEPKLQVVTVASNATDGFHRFMRSAELYGYSVEVLGLGQPWLGGDVKRYAGGGYKINLLKSFMESYKDDHETLILFTDSYDVIFTQPAKTLLDKFRQLKGKIIFTAERFCWPDRTLANSYPPVMGSSKYLNSGGFIGEAASIFEMLTVGKVEDIDDDQLYYTKLYLNPDQRNDLGMQLDYDSEIFQALFGSEEDVKIRFREDDAFVVNIEHNTEPALIHGNGLSKDVLSYMSNYLAKSWTPTGQCLACKRDSYELDALPKYPKVVLALFVEKNTPFLQEFFERIVAQEYPKDRIHLFLHNQQTYHAKEIKEFLKKIQKDYASITVKSIEDNLSESEARLAGMKECLTKKCDYYFSADSEAMFTQTKTIKHLLEANRTVLAPMLVRPGKLWSNFWGALSDEGFYARSDDYSEILDHTKLGIWNVPFISTAYAIRADKIKATILALETALKDPKTNDADIAWAKHMRDEGHFMYVTNLQYYGHLINPDSYDVNRVNPDFYQLIDNKLDWEYRYIHEDFHQIKLPDTKIEEPCPDVYWFPVVTKKYCEDLIAIMEGFGQWSNGANSDKRLQGGYENVPTRDIHMNQVGLERHWMLFLKDYIRPIQEKLYTGYFHDPPHALMNFVVRYKPEEQPALRPHHDSSTYTINVALNTPHVDYEGGGCRFIRYNCSVTESRVGWTLMHPGRLTHFHEGLPVTKGTRYIMISFVDP